MSSFLSIIPGADFDNADADADADDASTTVLCTTSGTSNGILILIQNAGVGMVSLFRWRDAWRPDKEWNICLASIVSAIGMGNDDAISHYFFFFFPLFANYVVGDDDDVDDDDGDDVCG